MILAIETATSVCSAALVHHASVVGQVSLNEKNVHSEKLLSVIDSIMTQGNVAPSAIESLAVSIGPGSFTGLRIGLSTAKGLALAWTVPIIPIPTLDGIAEEYRWTRTSASEEIFCAMIDAKRHEAFYAMYAVSTRSIRLLTNYDIKPLNEIELEAHQKSAVLSQPRCNAAAIGRIAERENSYKPEKDFSHMEPLYLREFAVTAPKNKIIH